MNCNPIDVVNKLLVVNFADQDLVTSNDLTISYFKCRKTIKYTRYLLENEKDRNQKFLMAIKVFSNLFHSDIKDLSFTSSIITLAVKLIKDRISQITDANQSSQAYALVSALVNKVVFNIWNGTNQPLSSVVNGTPMIWKSVFNDEFKKLHHPSIPNEIGFVYKREFSSKKELYLAEIVFEDQYKEQITEVIQEFLNSNPDIDSIYVQGCNRRIDRKVVEKALTSEAFNRFLWLHKHPSTWRFGSYSDGKLLSFDPLLIFESSVIKDFDKNYFFQDSKLPDVSEEAFQLISINAKNLNSLGITDFNVLELAKTAIALNIHRLSFRCDDHLCFRLSQQLLPLKSNLKAINSMSDVFVEKKKIAEDYQLIKLKARCERYLKVYQILGKMGNTSKELSEMNHLTLAKEALENIEDIVISLKEIKDCNCDVNSEVLNFICQAVFNYWKTSALSLDATLRKLPQDNKEWFDKVWDKFINKPFGFILNDQICLEKAKIELEYNQAKIVSAIRESYYLIKASLPNSTLRVHIQEINNAFDPHIFMIKSIAQPEIFQSFIKTARKIPACLCLGMDHQETLVEFNPVLVLQSAFFRRMLTHNMLEQTNNCIKLHDIEPQIFEIISSNALDPSLIVLKEENISDLISASNFLEMDSLHQHCLDFLTKSLEKSQLDENLINLLLYSNDNRLSDLKNLVKKKILSFASNGPSVSSPTVNFQPGPYKLVEIDFKAMSEEEILNQIKKSQFNALRVKPCSEDFQKLLVKVVDILENKLEHLDLSGCTGIVDSIGYFFIGRLKRLTTLNLSQCHSLTDLIGIDIIKLPMLKTLNLRGCKSIPRNFVDLYPRLKGIASFD